MIARQTARVALAAILLLALGLRLYFFVGLVSGDPQDDGVYYREAFAIYQNGGNNLDRFRNQPADWLPNPIDQFAVRSMIIYPIAGAFLAFGPGEGSAALWGLLCSLATVIVVYRLGSVLHTRATGLLAALLCAFYPLEVINATRVLSDVQVAMFTALGLLMLAEAERRNNPSMYALAGVAVGGAYLANARGLVVLVALVAAAGLQAWLSRPRVTRSAPLLVVAGFTAVFALEAVVYTVQTGDPLLSYHIQAGASYFKYVHEPVTSFDWGPLRVSYTNGEPLDLVRGVLGMTHRADQFGLFFVLFFAATLFSVIQRRNPLLAGLAIGLSLYLEFGPVQLALDRAARQLHYMMVFKQDRFLLMVSAPFLVMSADMLRALAHKSRLGAALIIGVLAATAYSSTRETHAYYRAGLNDLRIAAEYVRANPSVTFFGDYWAIEHVKVFTGHRADNLRVIGATTPAADLDGGCLLLGGSRGVELLADYVESVLPAFAREVLATGQAPPDWRLVRQLTGPTNPQRRHDLRIYCLP